MNIVNKNTTRAYAYQSTRLARDSTSTTPYLRPHSAKRWPITPRTGRRSARPRPLRPRQQGWPRQGPPPHLTVGLSCFSVEQACLAVGSPSCAWCDPSWTSAATPPLLLSPRRAPSWTAWCVASRPWAAREARRRCCLAEARRRRCLAAFLAPRQPPHSRATSRASRHRTSASAAAPRPLPRAG